MNGLSESKVKNVYLGVVSQIPNELLRVVISQTGAYIIHRIQNSMDLDFIKRNVPSVTLDIVSRIPNLQSETAILSGNEFEIPFEITIDGGQYSNVSSPLLPLK